MSTEIIFSVESLPIPTVKHVEEPATSKKDIKSMFSASGQGMKTEVKQETENADIKAEKETPKKHSPKKKEVSQSKTFNLLIPFIHQNLSLACQDTENGFGEIIDYFILFKTIIYEWTSQKERISAACKNRRFYFVGYV